MSSSSLQNIPRQLQPHDYFACSLSLLEHVKISVWGCEKVTFLFQKSLGYPRRKGFPFVLNAVTHYRRFAQAPLTLASPSAQVVQLPFCSPFCDIIVYWLFNSAIQKLLTLDDYVQGNQNRPWSLNRTPPSSKYRVKVHLWISCLLVIFSHHNCGLEKVQKGLSRTSTIRSV